MSMSISGFKTGSELRAHLQAVVASIPAIDTTSEQQLAIHRLKPITAQMQTPAMRAQAAADKASAAAMDALLATNRAQTAANKANTGMPLADVAALTPLEAKNTLAGVEKLIELGSSHLAIRGTNRDAMTTSLETYAGWLRERAGSILGTDQTANSAALVNITA